MIRRCYKKLDAQQSKGLFITGTGTDVGKTYVTGLILKKLVSEGKNAGYYKAAMSGNIRGLNGDLIPGDARFVKEMSGITGELSEMCPFVYEHAYSPHLASRIEGDPVDLATVKKGFEAVKEKYDFITVEGSGGILCPIEIDTCTIMLEDVIKELNLSTILIADAGLGTINAVVLTAFYMKSKGIPINGIIYNNYIPDDIMHDDNIAMCEKMTGIKTLARVTKDATELDIDILDLLDCYKKI